MNNLLFNQNHVYTLSYKVDIYTSFITVKYVIIIA